MNNLAGMKFTVAHWASLEAVKPIAIVEVAPEDFPYLEDIRGHRDEILFQRIQEDPNGFPWIDD